MADITQQHTPAHETGLMRWIKRLGSGLAIIAFPIMLLVGFVTHPNIFSFAMITDASEWANEWRGNFMFHFGHLLVLFAVPLIIAASVRLMSVPKARGRWLAFWGGVLSVFGAFMLAVDKGALTLVLSAFQEIPDPQFQAATPAFQALLDRGGWLWITWGFVALPVGFALIMFGLWRAEIVPRWQALCVIIGLALLINPDIEIISSIGAALMCAGLVPLGLRELLGRLG